MKFEKAMKFMQETNSVINTQIKLLKLAERESENSITWNDLRNYKRMQTITNLA